MSLTATFDAVNARVQLAGTALGATATQVYCWRSYDGFTTSQVLRGAMAAAMTGGVFNVDDYEFDPGRPTWYKMTSYNAADVQQASFTVGPTTYTIGDIWLKVPAAPYLNQIVDASVRTEITRPVRGGVFNVVGRTTPVLVSDVRGSRQFGLRLKTETAAAEDDLDYLFAAGEVLFIQVPAGVQFPGGYYSAGDVTRQPPGEGEWRINRARRYWDAPLVEVAAPGNDVIGAVYTWGAVLNDYATWSTLLAANATWSTLLNRRANPSDVIVS